MDIPDINCIVQIEIDYWTIGKYFYYGEELDAVFGLGLKMRSWRHVFMESTHGLALCDI